MNSVDIGKKIKEAESAKEMFKDEVICPLLERYKELKNLINFSMAEIKKYNQEISMIESEINRQMQLNSISKLSTDNFNLTISDDVYPKVVDSKLFFNWVMENDNYDLLPSKLIKKREFDRLSNDGVMPPGVSLNSISSLKITKKRSV